eukprot:scaffold304_cov216-Alexandrium_tamarense.AAC.5
MDRYIPQNRLLLTYEGLTDDQFGIDITSELNEFLGQAEGVTPLDKESVSCVWKAVVKNINPNLIDMQTDSQQEGLVDMQQQQRVRRNRKLQVNGSNSRPYTLDQLDKMMKMMTEIAERYQDDVQLHNIMKDYYEHIAHAKAELSLSEPPSSYSVITPFIVGEEESMEPLQVCGRGVPISVGVELRMKEEYSQCPRINAILENDKNIPMLILKGNDTYGRTGNNLIELMHALQHGREKGVVVAIMLDSWAIRLITSMWMAFPTDDLNGGFLSGGGIQEWKTEVEKVLCVKIILTYEELATYPNVIDMDTRDLFMSKANESVKDYIQFQMHNLRTLFRSYNQGIGVDFKNERVGSMCSVLDAIFGDNKSSAIYSVIHSRSLEGDPGLRLLKRISDSSGCDPLAALEMEPDYIKDILSPLGLLEHPILFITDHQRPEILERLIADPDIGPKIRLIPDEASWIGGDITAGITANAFIGNPASTFSGFIAKSRMALGFENNFLFRARNENGEWENVCEEKCIFYKVLDCSRNANENSVTCLKFHLVYSHMLYCIVPSSGL